MSNILRKHQRQLEIKKFKLLGKRYRKAINESKKELTKQKETYEFIESKKTNP